MTLSIVITECQNEGMIKQSFIVEITDHSPKLGENKLLTEECWCIWVRGQCRVKYI